MNNRKVIVAITGASGAIYGLKLLERLRGLTLQGLEASRLAGTVERPVENRGLTKGKRTKLPDELLHSQDQSYQLSDESRVADKDLVSEVAVILTGNAEEIMLHETGQGYLPSGVERLWQNNDFNAPFASGSSSYDTMIICPASMGMVGRIAHGVSDDLITRAADVMLKERRRLIVVPRETPYSLIHIINMKLLTEAGAIVCPATPSFYSRPQTIDDLVMTVTDRVMTLAGFSVNTFRWNEKDGS